MIDLSGAFAKLARAKHHADDFNAQGFQWLASTLPHDKPPVTKRFEPSEEDPAEGVVTYSILPDIGTPDPPIELSLIFGDALTNYRAVLDYLAVQLAVNPPKIDDVKFPLTNDRNHFTRTVANRIPGIDPTHRAILERYQPYQHGSQAGSHPLRLLNRLVNHDKHRALRLMAASNMQIKAQVPGDFPNFEVYRTEGRNIPFDFEADTDVLRIYGRLRDPSQDLDVQVYWHDATYGVRLVDEPHQADVVLTMADRMVSDLLNEFAAVT